MFSTYVASVLREVTLSLLNAVYVRRFRTECRISTAVCRINTIVRFVTNSVSNDMSCTRGSILSTTGSLPETCHHPWSTNLLIVRKMASVQHSRTISLPPRVTTPQDYNLKKDIVHIYAPFPSLAPLMWDFQIMCGKHCNKMSCGKI